MVDFNKLCMHCMNVTDVSEGEACPHCGHPFHVYGEIHHQLKPYSILQGKYLVGDILGEGGFGITYIGFDMNLEVKVAVKEFYPNGYVTREAMTTTAVTIYAGQSMEAVNKWRDGFLQEARTLGRCTNLPGVVGVRDFFQENNTAYIILEYLEGMTLKEYMRSIGGKIPANVLLPKMESVITSMGAVNRQGIIHRDISPDNIMLLPNGQLKLLDFGAARDYTESGEKSLSVMLKPGYAPEEQYRSKGKQGPWSDVYAMAGSIYKCLTGVTPVESMERMRKDELRRPNELGAGLTPAQENALMKAMAVYAEDRYQSMEEFHRDLYPNRNPAAAQPVMSMPVNKAPSGSAPVTGMPSGNTPAENTMGKVQESGMGSASAAVQNDGSGYDIARAGENKQGNSLDLKWIILGICVVFVLLAVVGLGIIVVRTGARLTKTSKTKTERITEDYEEETVPDLESEPEASDISDEEINGVLLPIDESVADGLEKIEDDDTLVEGIELLEMAIDQYRDAAPSISDTELLTERIEAAYAGYKQGILRQIELLDSQSIAEGVGDRYSQMLDELSDAIHIGENLSDEGYEMDVSDLESYYDDIEEYYPRMVIQEFNRFTGDKLTENGTWSRTEAWNMMSSTYDCGMFEEDDLDDPIRLRYAYALAYFVQRQNEKDLADKLITPAAAAERIASQMEEMDYSPLQLAYYIAYRREAGLPYEDALDAYDDVYDYIARKEGIRLGEDIPIELFWYFNDVDDEDTRADAWNGLTRETRQWVRNRISAVDF